MPPTDLAANGNAAFTFTLPPEATRGTIRLSAELDIYPGSVSDLSECKELRCSQNNTFTLDSGNVARIARTYLSASVLRKGKPTIPVIAMMYFVPSAER